jgi:hypothetical protein
MPGGIMARQRRSFPIKISTKFADRSVQEAVVLDLVHKFPRGPEGTFEKTDYYQYDTDPGLNRSVDADSDTICGYSDVDLYRMVMNLTEVTDSNPTSEWDYRQLVQSMFPNVGQRGVTRRSRRMAARLGRAVRAVKNRGLSGIWDVSWGYDDTDKAMMHADSSEDALNQAKIFFGPIIGEDNYRLGASFVREGSPLELLTANDSMLKGFDRLVAQQNKRIQDIKEEIESYEMGKSFVEMYAINCMAVETSDLEV